jgi:hypothetical protein
LEEEAREGIRGGGGAGGDWRRRRRMRDWWRASETPGRAGF